MVGMQSRRKFLIGAASTALVPPASEARVLRGSLQTHDVFIIAGQSNAGDGNGLDATGLNPHSVATDPGIQIWNGSAFTTLINATNNDILQDPTSHTWGPEVEFAYQWRLANNGRPLYLVKHAIGSTGLDATTFTDCWAPPSISVSGTRYFNLVTTAVANALATLPNPRVRAVLWMQGENDGAFGAACAGRYQANLTTFCNAIPVYWGDASTKILIGRVLNSETDAPTVRAAQDAVGVASPTFTRVINTDAYPFSGVHYLASGQVDLGADMFTQYMTF